MEAFTERLITVNSRLEKAWWTAEHVDMFAKEIKRLTNIPDYIVDVLEWTVWLAFELDLLNIRQSNCKRRRILKL